MHIYIYMMTQNIGETIISSGSGENSQMVDYMLHNTTDQEEEEEPIPYDIDKFNFQDVMQFPDFDPKINQACSRNIPDPNIYFLKFPVLNDSLHEHGHEHVDLMFDSTSTGDIRGGGGEHDEIRGGVSENDNDSSATQQQQQQLRFINNLDQMKCPPSHDINQVVVVKNKKKRARSIKTTEEVESQRMTHIAVERNRRKQMNEHLRVLRSLMPGSYVQRGDQASIIGGAIEFVRELEQLLQCLESQKRRRLYGDATTNPNTTTLVVVDQEAPTHQPPFFPLLPPPNDELENGSGREESAESKSCIADVEVKLLGFDAMIKILSRRRVGQLVKTIAALEDLQLNILHINITTIDQTVLYSLTVKVGGEARLTAEDIANSVQQIFTFIHAYNNI